MVFGPTTEEAVEAAGREDLPLSVRDGGKGGKDVVQWWIGEEVDSSFGNAGWGHEAIKALNGEGCIGEHLSLRWIKRSRGAMAWFDRAWPGRCDPKELFE